MFFMGLRVLVRSTRQNATARNKCSNARTAVELLVGICVLMILFGMGWIFGVLTIDVPSKVFKYIFVITNVLQGFCFFLFICLFGKDGRKFWIDLLKYKSSNKKVKSMLTYDHHSQSFKFVQSGSSKAPGKQTSLTTSGISDGLHSQPTVHCLSANNETKLQGVNKLAMMMEEENALNGLNQQDGTNVITNANFTEVGESSL